MVHRPHSGPGAVILEICELSCRWIVDCSLNRVLKKKKAQIQWSAYSRRGGMPILAGLIKPDLMRNKTPRRSSWNNGFLLSKRLCPVYDGVWLVSQQNFHEAQCA